MYLCTCACMCVVGVWVRVGAEEPSLIFHAIVVVENEHFVTLYSRLNEFPLYNSISSTLDLLQRSV